MARVLVVDDQRHVRNALVAILVEAGYDVLEAANGKLALETAYHEQIDIILLDVEMPVMDGWQVLTNLKERPETQSIPIIMLTSVPLVKGEAEGMRLGAEHYIPKPWNSETVALTVKVALREAKGVADEERHASMVWRGSPPVGWVSSGAEEFIRPAGDLTPLEQILDGGIHLGSLTLIEGPTAVGKSVLCQYLAYGAMLEGHGVAYFTSEHTPNSLGTQMGSIGLDMSDYLQTDKLGIYPIREPIADNDTETMLAELAPEIGRLPSDYNFVVVDGVTRLAQSSQDRAVIGFFSSCNRLCKDGRTIVVVSQSSAFEEDMLVRLHGLCNSHISLGAEKIRGKLVKTLEVRKVRDTELNRDNMITFQVEPEVGIKILPMSKVKA